jgi:hypothetical protein
LSKGFASVGLHFVSFRLILMFKFHDFSLFTAFADRAPFELSSNPSRSVTSLSSFKAPN